MDGTLEAVEGVTLTLHYDLECLVIVISTNFACSHGKLLLYHELLKNLIS